MFQKKRMTFVLAILLVMMITAGCGLLNSSLIVINNSSVDVCQVSLTDSAGASIDYLVDPVNSGDSYTIDDIPPAEYGVTFSPCDSATYLPLEDTVDLTTDLEYTLTD